MNVRKLALEAINRILNKGGYSNIVINEFFNKYELTNEEKALFTRLVLGTIEYKLTLEYYLEPFLKKKQKPWIHNLLLMSAYQIVYLNIPEHAIVNESVSIANLKDRSIGSFVNAVLRNFLRTEIRGFDNLDDLNKLSIKYSYPSWLVAYLLKDYKYEDVQKIFEENSLIRSTSIRVNTLKSSLDEVMNVFDGEGIKYKKNNLVTNGLMIDRNIINHSLFSSGKIIIQDIASQKVSEVLNPKKNSIIIDLCAAPGGKSSHIASIIENQGTIYACDIHDHKLKLMERNFKKLGVNCVKTQLVDARLVKDFVKQESFDYVLADLPCSGLGVLGHKVDLKYHMTLESIDEIIQLQEEILSSCSNLVKKGGYLVVSTCTINKKENEEQVRNFLKNNKNYEIEEEMTILPYMYHTDGFYICKLRRN